MSSSQRRIGLLFAKGDEVKIEYIVFLFEISQSSQKIRHPTEGIRSSRPPKDFVVEALNPKTIPDSRELFVGRVECFYQTKDLVLRVRIKLKTQFC